MKKFYYILFLLLSMLVCVGCSDENLYDGEGEQITLLYSVKLDDEVKPRAIGDGSNINQLLVGIFQNGAQLTIKEFPVSDNQVNITLQLLKSETYQLVFWAQTKDNGIYNTDNLNNIIVNYSNFTKPQAIATNLDAFYATRTVSVENSAKEGVTLTRPFTQFGVGVYGSETEVGNVKSVEIKITGTLYTGFKPLATGEKAVAGNASEYIFNFTGLNDKSDSFIINGTNYTLLSTNYFLVPTQTNATISGSVSLKNENGNSLSEFQFTDAPLLLNTRVNIGKGL